MLLNAMNFYNNDVKTRCIFLKTPGDVFAADMFYHSNCLRTYFRPFEKKCDAVLKNIAQSNNRMEIDENSRAVFEFLDFNSIELNIDSPKECFLTTEEPKSC